MNAAVLFAGIGGWEIACERNGIEVLWAAEWDDWKRARYKDRWPHTPLYGDVGSLNGSSLIADHGRIDLLLASPPCTDISAANVNGKGIEGEESKYYLEAIRLARELGVDWCGFENSPRLRTRGADRVLSELEKSGYSCWGHVVEAEDAGAPHERGRSFIIGCRRDIIARADAKRARLWLEQGRGSWTDGSGSAEFAGDARNATSGRPGEASEQICQGRKIEADGGSRRQTHANANIDGQSDCTVHAEVGRRTRIDAGSCGRDGETADVYGEHGRPRAGWRNGPKTDYGSGETPCHTDRPRLAKWQGVGGNPFEKLTAAQRTTLCPWDNGGYGLARYLSMADGVGRRLRLRGLSDRKVKSEMSKMRSALGDALVIPVVWAVVRAIVRTRDQWGLKQ